MFNYSKKTEFGTETNMPKLITHLVGFGVLGIILLVLVFGSWTTINEGERGIVLRLGKVERIMEPGFNWKTPFLERVVKMEVRTQKQEVQASAASKDLQVVTSNIAIQYNVISESVGVLYADIGTSYRSRIIDPAIQDAVKATTANFTAEELITKRAIASEEMEELLRARLLETHVAVTNVDIVNFDFSTSFNQAIEQKVTAKELALKAENDLEKVKFEQQQEIEKYKAQAEQTRLQTEALRQSTSFLELKRLEVQMEYAKKWDGKLPTTFVPGSAIPFIDALNTR